MDTLAVLTCITLVLLDMCCFTYLVKSFKQSIEGTINKLLRELEKEEE